MSLKHLALSLLLGGWLGAQELPPGHNVHSVVQRKEYTLWRGGGPTRETLVRLQAVGHKVTLIDLRQPAFEDDLKGGGGRLTPAAEAQLAGELGFRYRSISALDRQLITVIDQALQEGDVYLHCQYGVNRTGFAMGRYATARGLKLDRSKLGERDWNQGVNFERKLQPAGHEAGHQETQGQR